MPWEWGAWEHHFLFFQATGFLSDKNISEVYVNKRGNFEIIAFLQIFTE
jgi:hypothetical protein